MADAILFWGPWACLAVGIFVAYQMIQIRRTLGPFRFRNELATVMSEHALLTFLWLVWLMVHAIARMVDMVPGVLDQWSAPGLIVLAFGILSTFAMRVHLWYRKRVDDIGTRTDN